MFFITVACGILSGFHSTQTAIISRTMKSEKQGRMTFYNMMILEGFIAMIWAAAAMGVYNLGLQEVNASLATGTVASICRDLLGPVGASSPCWASSFLPITSGDTALRSLRLSISDSHAHRPELQAEAFGPVRHHLRAGGCDSGLCEEQPRWIQSAVALLRMVQPDPVPVRIPGYLRMDVREQQGQVGVDSPDSRLLGTPLVTVTFIANAQFGFHISLDARPYIIGVCAAVAYVAIIVWYGKKRRCPAPEAVSCNYFLKQTPSRHLAGRVSFLSQNHAHA